jgi:hypothetical protein
MSQSFLSMFLRAVAVGCFALVLCGTGEASPRLILNQDETSNCLLGDEVRIAADTGDLYVAVANLDDCLPAEAGLGVSSVVVTPASVLPPAQIQVIWASIGADSCRAGGTLPAWNNQGTLPLQGPVNFSVPSGTASGAYRIDVICAKNGEEVSGQNSNNLTVTSPLAPPQPSLSATSPVSPGGTVTVTWSSQSATACTAGGNFPGWSGSKNTSGSQNITTSNSLASGTYNLTLTCSNNGGASPAAQASVVVQAGVPQACSGDRAPPPGLVRTSSCKLSPQSGDCREFDNIFGAWPGTSSLRWFSMAQGTYVAARIKPLQTVPPNARSSMGFDILQGQYAGYSMGPMLWSISTCPGDFNLQAITAEQGQFCVGSIPNNGAFWGGRDAPLGHCKLEPNTTYYLNLLFTNQQPGTANSALNWFCQTDNCGMQLSIPTAINW